MKLLRLASLLAVASVTAFSLAAQGDITQKLQAVYSKLDALALKKDMTNLTKVLYENTTKDCVFIAKPDANGKREQKTREDTMKTMTGVMPLVDKIDMSKSHIDHVKVGPNSVVATVTSILAMTTKKTDATPAHKIVEKSTSEDTWVKVGGSWKLKSSKTLTDVVTQDGKTVG